MRSLVLSVAALLLLAACSVPKLDTTDRSCPCSTGYTCVRDVCVEDDDVVVDSGTDAKTDAAPVVDSGNPIMDSSMPMDSSTPMDASMDSGSDAGPSWCNFSGNFSQFITEYIAPTSCSQDTANAYALCADEACRTSVVNGDPNPGCEACVTRNSWHCANENDCQSKWETVACCANQAGNPSLTVCPGDNNKYKTCTNGQRGACRAQVVAACMPPVMELDSGMPDSGMPDSGMPMDAGMDSGGGGGWCSGDATPYLQNPSSTWADFCAPSVTTCADLCFLDEVCQRNCYKNAKKVGGAPDPECTQCAENNYGSCARFKGCSAQWEAVACCANTNNAAPTSAVCSGEFQALNNCLWLGTLDCASRRRQCD